MRVLYKKFNFKGDFNMFNSTFSHIKKLVKESFNLVKDVTLGTITAVKDDICEEHELRKEVKALREAKKASNSSAKAD